MFGITKIIQTGQYAFVMRYYQNGNLRSSFQETHNVSWQKNVERLYQLTYGLHKIHEQGLIHCDLHSGNVLIDKKNGEEIVVISDFGLC